MFTNIPSSDELEQTALRIFFVAFRELLTVVGDLTNKQLFKANIIDRKIVPLADEEHCRTAGETEDMIKEYIRLSQPELQLSYTLIQQSQEIGLKSIICEESPFLLLIGSDVRNWGPNKDFTDMRTIDAGDLIKVVNAIRPTQLDNKFTNTYNDLRKGRNKISHLGQFRDQIDPIYLLDVAIYQYQSLYPGRIWIQDLILYERNHRHTIFTADHYSDQNSALLTYISVEEAATKSQRKFLLGASASSNLYRCPECHSGDYMACDMGVGLTLQVDTRARSGNCAICLENFPLTRKKCHYCSQSNIFIDNGGDEDTCCYCGETWKDHAS